MIKVKITATNLPLWRQIPNESGIWNGEYCFYFNDEKMRECDYWLVFDDYGIDKDSVAVCPKENIYLVMGEADGIHIYNKSFVKQFHNIVTVQKNRYDVPKTYNKYLSPWFVGFRFDDKGFDGKYDKGYNELVDMEKIEKSKLISVISSNKVLSKGHRDRLAFVEKLKKHFGDDLDVFGRGINSFSDKWDVIAPYKYHIAIENQCVYNYYTEKFIDSYMGESYPIYYGCPNIEEYFNKKSFSCIDINNPTGAMKVIEDVINRKLYENNFEYVKETRNLLLNKYNMIAEIVAMLSENNYSGNPMMNTLHTEKYFSKRNQLKRKLKSLWI